jgi:LPXTG-motif cell wall-anchored protein
VLQGGKTTKSSLTAGSTGVTLTSGGLSMWVSAYVNGKNVPLHSSTTVVVEKGGRMHVKVAGFLPGSKVTIWGHSTPVELASFTATTSGTIEHEFTLPESIAVGDHTLVVEGTSDQNQPTSMQVGIRVVDKAASAASSVTSNANWWWLVVLALIVIAILFFVLWRRRRREHEEGPVTQ